MTERTATGDGEAARPVRPPRPGPPPRPPLTSTVPPPVPRAAPRAPGTVRASAWCWGLSVLAGLLALGAAAADLAGVRQRLAAAGAVADPTATAELLRAGADTTVAAVLGALAALVVLTAGCLALYLRHRAGRRSALTVLGLLTLTADALAQDLLTGGPELDRGAVLVQGALVVLALVLLALPASRGWGRRPAR
jgi:hypothetical protein